jgi:flagellar hook assembly protein FlgD
VNLGYRLKKDGKVTITVYNYAMEKVKTLVKSAPRKAGGSRSEVVSEDRWDGKDASGRNVSVGVYYILVQSDKGEKGWGKAIAVRGRDQ